MIYLIAASGPVALTVSILIVLMGIILMLPWSRFPGKHRSLGHKRARQPLKFEETRPGFLTLRRSDDSIETSIDDWLAIAKAIVYGNPYVSSISDTTVTHDTNGGFQFSRGFNHCEHWADVRGVDMRFAAQDETLLVHALLEHISGREKVQERSTHTTATHLDGFQVPSFRHVSLGVYSVTANDVTVEGRYDEWQALLLAIDRGTNFAAGFYLACAWNGKDLQLYSPRARRFDHEVITVPSSAVAAFTALARMRMLNDVKNSTVGQ